MLHALGHKQIGLDMTQSQDNQWEHVQELRRRGKQPARSRGDDVQSPDLQLLYSMAQ